MSSLRLMTGLNDGDGGSLKLALGIPLLFSIWITLETRWLSQRQRGMDGRRDLGFQVGYCDGTFVEIALWVDSDDWSSSKEKRFLGVKYRTGHRGWAHYWFHPVDIILGHGSAPVISTRLGTAGLKVRMPEGEYPVSIEYETRRWKRKRWFAGKPFTTVNVKVLGDGPDGQGCIPYPGKGENSWDCGMDGLCGSGFPGDLTEREILDKVQLDVLETRRRRTGNRLWVPPVKEVEAG